MLLAKLGFELITFGLGLFSLMIGVILISSVSAMMSAGLVLSLFSFLTA